MADGMVAAVADATSAARAAAEAVAALPRLIVMLDFDGTLAPIAPRPADAVLPDRARRVLAALADVLPVAVVSGRDRDDVAAHVGVAGIMYAGSHGLDVDGVAPPPEALAAVPALADAAAELHHRVGGIPGVVIERKRFGVALHHRLVAPGHVGQVRQAVQALARPPLRCIEGRRVDELRPDVPWDKGTAVAALRRALDADAVALYIGDDRTDEDAFRALPDGITVAVHAKPRPTAAKHAVAGPEDVQELLERVAAAVAPAAATRAPSRTPTR